MLGQTGRLTDRSSGVVVGFGWIPGVVLAIDVVRATSPVRPELAVGAVVLLTVVLLGIAGCRRVRHAMARIFDTSALVSVVFAGVIARRRVRRHRSDPGARSPVPPLYVAATFPVRPHSKRSRPRLEEGYRPARREHHGQRDGHA